MSLWVNVQYAVSRRGLPSPGSLRTWAQEAAGSRHDAAQVTLRVVGREESAHLNECYRGVSAPTNVLSFPMGAVVGGEPAWLGDIVLCAPVVEEQARAQGKPARDHWAHLVVHGVLHLLGYDHSAPGEACIMEGLERAILGRLGYPDPYAVEDPDER